MGEERLRTPEVELLLSAFTSLQDEDEAFALLQDLCTIREMQEMAGRLHVARLLDGGAHYADIQRLTGASATTISRVSRCLQHGSGGYRTVLPRLDASAEADLPASALLSDPTEG